jgi:hypothetical protein
LMRVPSGDERGPSAATQAWLEAEVCGLL